MPANILDGDVNAIMMSDAMHTDGRTSSTAIAFMLLYICHTVGSFLLNRFNQEKTVQWIQLKRNLFMVLGTIASNLILNKPTGWFPNLLVWFIVVSYIASYVLLLVGDKREEDIYKYVVVARNGLLIVYWLIYWILQISNT